MKKLTRIVILFLMISLGTLWGYANEMNKNIYTLGSIQGKKGAVSEPAADYNSIIEMGLNHEKLLSQDDIKNFSLQDLAILRNTIYASRGYSFSTEKYKKFFSKFDWYTPQGKDIYDNLMDIEKKNLELIIWMERKQLVELNSTTEKLEISYDNATRTYLGDEYIDITFKKWDVNGNNPLKVELVGAENSLEFKSNWNDGIFLSKARLGENREDEVIILTHGGTDVGCYSMIYGINTITKKIELLDKIFHTYDYLFTSSSGHIYFKDRNNPSNYNLIDKVYDIRSGEETDVWDTTTQNKLRRQLETANKTKFSDDTILENHVKVEHKYYSFDIDYDNKEEEIVFDLISENGFICYYQLHIKDNGKVFSSEKMYAMNISTNLRFIPMDNKMYISVYDLGPSDDPVSTLFAFKEGKIEKVLDIEGGIESYSPDGKVNSHFSYVAEKSNLLFYYDLNKRDIIYTPKESLIGKKLSYNIHLMLNSSNTGNTGNGAIHYSFVSEDYLEDMGVREIVKSIHDDSNFPSTHPKEYNLYRYVVCITEKNENLEIIDVDYDAYDGWVRNIPIKVRTADGSEGWILWRNGGD